MRKLLIVLMLGLSLHANEIIIKESIHGVNESIEKLKTLVTQKGFVVFDVIDHTQNAKDVNMSIEQSKVLIFGNPKGGTALMQENILVGLDLPLRVLVFQDKEGKTQMAYRNGTWIKNTYSLKNDALITKVNGGLDMLVSEACK
jgi:uncharacterized protein (DUF302 family)